MKHLKEPVQHHRVPAHKLTQCNRQQSGLRMWAWPHFGRFWLFVFLFNIQSLCETWLFTHVIPPHENHHTCLTSLNSTSSKENRPNQCQIPCSQTAMPIMCQCFIHFTHKDPEMIGQNEYGLNLQQNNKQAMKCVLHIYNSFSKTCPDHSYL